MDAMAQDPRVDQDLAAPAAASPAPASGGRRSASSTCATAAGFTYIDGHRPDGSTLPLCRLRYVGSANQWGVAIYRASHDDYEESILPTGSTVGTSEDALDTRLRPLPQRPHRLADLRPPTN